MRDFGLASTVSGENGRYHGTLEEGWEIWGPQGGYVATLALRAAGRASELPRPASLACHFLRPARIGPVELRVESMRRTRRAESLAVTLSQDDDPVLHALVWTIAELTGLDHDAAPAPEAPEPEQVEPWDTAGPDGEPLFPFWSNVEVRPVLPGTSEWRGPRKPRSLGWTRLRARPPLEDPFVDAGRMLVAADSTMYPAAALAHEEPFPYLAPSMDLVMSFHAPGAASEWLLVEAGSPISRGALVAGSASIWSSDGRLLASALQQMLQRT